MTYRKPTTLVRAALAIGAPMLLVFAVPALGKGTPPPPVSSTVCNGSLDRTPTKTEPNLLGYKFHCDWGITAYTLAVTRQPDNFGAIDDFSPTAVVVTTTGTVVTTESAICDGLIPGDGVNCTAGGGKSYVAAPNYIEGSFDTTDPYCGVAGTKRAAAEPQAVVQLIVTDTNGAQDGPFRLHLGRSCKAIANASRHRHHRSHSHQRH